jgi:3-phosphoglycerate kinase
MKLPQLADFSFQGKKVLVRGDLDVPLKDGIVEDDSRLRECLPTVRYLLEQGASIILMGHLGRPAGRVVEELKMAPIRKRLAELLGFTNFTLLKNLRFDPGEESNDPELAKKLASLGDFYVNEAFATSHREHASIVGVPKLLPHCAGLHFASEVENLSQIIENPAKPLVVIIGGAKVESKLPVIEGLFEKADIFLTGGVVANTLMIAEPNHPKSLGQSLFDKTMITEAKRILGLERGERVDYPVVGPTWKIKMPPDVVVAAKTGESYKDVKTVYVARESGEVFDQGKMIVDIGPETIDLYKRVIEQANTIVFAGPMGIFEKEEFSQGTKGVLEAVASSKAFKIVGGGDTIAALTKFNLIDKMDYVSTGGGAMLEFLTKGTLPGIDAL